MPRILADTTPLRESPEFARIWWGLGLANIGSQLTVVAVGLEVYKLTGSTLAVGVLGLCALVPLIGFGLYGGALVDAHDRRRVALIASGVMWLVTMGIAAQAWAGLEQVWILYALVAVQSAAAAVNSPARSAIVPRLLRPQLLPAANALMALTWNIALMGGPVLGAGLVATVGYGPTYTVDVITFTLALYALVRLPPMPPGASADGAPRPRGWRSVADGLRYLAGRPNVRMTFMIDMAAMVLAQPSSLFPAIGVWVLGGAETTTGVLTAAVAAGSAIAAVLSGPLGRVHAQGRAVAWAVTGWGASIAVFGLVLVAAGRTRPDHVIVWALVGACLALALAGASDAISMVFRNTMLQAATPDELRGRLQGVFTVVVAGGPRLGQMVSGADAGWAGEGWAAVIGGVACVAAVAILMRVQPAFLRYDARNPVP